MKAARVIGIMHRRKQTREQEARPTMVAIKTGDTVVEHKLETETHELDFLKGQFAIEWRKLEDGEEVLDWFSEESLTGYRLHQCKWRKLKKEERDGDFPEGRVKWIPDKKTGNQLPHLLTHVPVKFDGLAEGDVVSMLLGGSGDRFAAALSRQGEKFGAVVYRIPPNVLKGLRADAKKEDDHQTLVRLLDEKLVEDSHDLRPFYKVRLRDRELIRVKEALSLRGEAMRSRIACKQRIQQAAIGRIFLNEEGMWPEGLVEHIYKDEQANDVVLQQLEAEEKRRDAELKRAVQKLEIWKRVFEPIEGCGERLAAGIIAAVGDIRRFQVDPDQEEMDRLQREALQYEIEGNFEADIDKIPQERVTPGTNRYRMLQLVRSWKRRVGKQAEAAALDDAIECHKKRAVLRQEAYRKGRGKFQHFVGVFVRNGGKYGEVSRNKQFPRRRRGETADWHPEPRQAFYLLADQFNRRPASQWGQARLAQKKRLREVHPEVIEEQVKSMEEGKLVAKKRFTDGHIHKMSAWSTLGQFVRHLFREWTAIEKEALAKNGS